MKTPNQVQPKVWHYALLLEEFTVAQIVELTGHKSVSVRTAVQRMKQAEFVTVSRRIRQGRGGPVCVYKITDDPEARLRLSRSVAEFYAEARPRPVEPRRPTSPHFSEAIEYIRALVSGEVPDDAYDAAIERARYHLEFARREEGVGREGTEIVRACLDRERALLEAIQGNTDVAESLLRTSVEAFQSAGLQAEVERANKDWLIASLRCEIESAKRDGTQSRLRTVELLQRFLSNACERVSAEDPLACLLRDLFHFLAEKELQEQPKNQLPQYMRELASATARQAVEKVVWELQRFQMLSATLNSRAQLERSGSQVFDPRLSAYDEAEKPYPDYWQGLTSRQKRARQDD